MLPAVRARGSSKLPVAGVINMDSTESCNTRGQSPLSNPSLSLRGKQEAGGQGDRVWCLLCGPDGAAQRTSAVRWWLILPYWIHNHGWAQTDFTNPAELQLEIVALYLKKKKRLSEESLLLILLACLKFVCTADHIELLVSYYAVTQCTVLNIHQAVRPCRSFDWCIIINTNFSAPQQKKKERKKTQACTCTHVHTRSNGPEGIHFST